MVRLIKEQRAKDLERAPGALTAPPRSKVAKNKSKKPKKKEETSEEKVRMVDYVIEELMAGSSLHRICNQPDMPKRATILRWISELHNAEETKQIIETAKLLQSEALFDDIQEVTNEVRAGGLTPSAGKVIIDSLQWRAEKLNPRKFAEQKANKENGPPIHVAVINSGMTSSEAAMVYIECIRGVS